MAIMDNQHLVVSLMLCMACSYGREHCPDLPYINKTETACTRYTGSGNLTMECPEYTVINIIQTEYGKDYGLFEDECYYDNDDCVYSVHLYNEPFFNRTICKCDYQNKCRITAQSIETRDGNCFGDKTEYIFVKYQCVFDNVVCQTQCSEEIMHMNCMEGKVIHIINLDFGSDKNSDVCHYENDHCLYPIALNDNKYYQSITATCEHSTACSFPVKSIEPVTECDIPGGLKPTEYILVQYQCVEHDPDSFTTTVTSSTSMSVSEYSSISSTISRSTGRNAPSTTELVTTPAHSDILSSAMTTEDQTAEPAVPALALTIGIIVAVVSVVTIVVVVLVVLCVKRKQTKDKSANRDSYDSAQTRNVATNPTYGSVIENDYDCPDKRSTVDHNDLVVQDNANYATATQDVFNPNPDETELVDNSGYAPWKGRSADGHNIPNFVETTMVDNNGYTNYNYSTVDRQNAANDTVLVDNSGYAPWKIPHKRESPKEVNPDDTVLVDNHGYAPWKNPFRQNQKALNYEDATLVVDNNKYETWDGPDEKNYAVVASDDTVLVDNEHYQNGYFNAGAEFDSSEFDLVENANYRPLKNV